MPSAHGAWSLGTNLSENHETVASVLTGHGYRTALVGKAHFQCLINDEKFPSVESYPLLRDIDYWRKHTGPWYGFERVEMTRNHGDEAHAGQHYAAWMEDKGLKDWKKHFQNESFGYDFNDPDHPTGTQEHKWSIPEEYHYNTWIAERSNALMEDCVAEDKPFFLWSSFHDPHPPYLVPEPWDTMYDAAEVTVPEAVPGEHDKNPEHFRKAREPNPDFKDWANEPGGNAIHGCHSHVHTKAAMAKNIAVYYGMISCMDTYIGQILDKLDELEIADDTIVVFTSDHGHFFGQHGLMAKGPFHYEDLVRVPFIASWPKHIPAGEQSEALQSLVDLAPTFIRAGGAEVPFAMTGVNQLPAWRGETPAAREYAVVENRHQPSTIHVKTYVDERYKLTVYYGQSFGELFDLEEDPGEVSNLWEEPSARALKQELTTKLLHACMGNESMPMPRVAPA